jgi:polysaccharide biosynthesis protein PslH
VSDLLVCTHTPILRSGQTVRTYGVARALAAANGLTLLYARFEGDEPDEAFASIPGIELHEALPSRGARRMLAYGAARMSGVPGGFARGISPELAREARRLADLPGRARVIADGPIAAAALAPLARGRPVIYNAHNVESAFRGELSDSGPIKTLRRFERGLLERAAESWMVSEADIEAARALCPSAKLRYVPNVVDTSAIRPVSGEASQRAVFVANFAYEPNRNGLRFLLDEVFPRVWEQLPEARLALVGGGLEDEPPSSDPRVELVGFVSELRLAYEDARCAVVPLLQGGGTPLKFVEAMAYGLPVLATPRAAAGLAVQNGVDCVLAEGAPDFASALVELLRAGAPEIGRRGRALAVERYSIEALTGLLSD